MIQKSIDTGKGKIQKICDVLKNEAIEPAKQEAKEIIENAKMQAEEIVKKAQMQAEETIKKSQSEIVQQQNVFKSSLLLAKKQAIDSLKQDIEKKLFDKSLSELVVEASTDTNVLKEMIVSIVKATEEEGLDLDVSVLIPKTVSRKEIKQLIGQKILEMLKAGAVEVGDFDGGIKVSLKDNNITIDISNDALFQCIAKYVRSDFRDMMFKESDE